MSSRDQMAPARPIVAERSGGMCERCAAKRASDMHHRQLRRHGDHSPANLVHLCRECHNWVHGNIPEARAVGFLLLSTSVAAEAPVEHGVLGRVLLDVDGSVLPVVDSSFELRDPMQQRFDHLHEKARVGAGSGSAEDIGELFVGEHEREHIGAEK